MQTIKQWTPIKALSSS